MKLVVRVQYIGERARQLLRSELAAEYTKGLIDDLEHFGFPMPQEQKPIEKSGFMLCVWHVDRESELHHAVQNAFIKAKSEAVHLADRSIRYISLNEDGVTHTTSLMNKPYKPKSYMKPEMLAPQSFSLASAYNKPYGKAPKYPTSISQARRGVTPLSQRISGPESTGPYNDYGSKDIEMHSPPERTPPKDGEGSSSMIDVTQQTLLQLSQSSAFQSLLLRGPGTSPIKTDPPPSDLSSLLRGPTSPPAQPDISNLQALLEKAGLKSASAQAILLSGQPNLGDIPVLRAGTSFSGASATSLSPTLGSTSSTPLGLPLRSPPLSPPGVSSGSAAVPTFPRPTPSASTSRGQPTSANEAMRELWDIRRQITALQARDGELMDLLQRLGQPVSPMEGMIPANTELRIKGFLDEINGLRDALRHEQQTRKVAEATLRAERLRRDEVETAMQDTQRELQQPFVVPALLDAFMKIGQMTGETLRDHHPSTSGAGASAAHSSMDI